MPDVEKVINAIEKCLNFDDACNECDYDGCVFKHGSCEKDLLADALALLKEQEKQKFFVDENGKITPLPVVVRCKDCEYRGNKSRCIVAFIADKQEFPVCFYDNRGEWFCSDGKRKSTT